MRVLWFTWISGKQGWELKILYPASTCTYENYRCKKFDEWTVLTLNIADVWCSWIWLLGLIRGQGVRSKSSNWLGPLSVSVPLVCMQRWSTGIAWMQVLGRFWHLSVLCNGSIMDGLFLGISLSKLTAGKDCGKTMSRPIECILPIYSLIFSLTSLVQFTFLCSMGVEENLNCEYGFSYWFATKPLDIELYYLYFCLFQAPL